MANEEQVVWLRKGAKFWNQWRNVNLGIMPYLNGVNRGVITDLSGAKLNVWKLRSANRGIMPDLCGAKLRGANLRGTELRCADLQDADLRDADLQESGLGDADLSGANLRGANLVNADLGSTRMFGAILADANLNRVYLVDANLVKADLRGANLGNADLSGATLIAANLGGANLNGANLRGANLVDADLSTAILYETVFADTDLTNAKGLETCQHRGPSSIDYRTLQRSGPLPLTFLRGVGLPGNLIDYLPSILEQAIQFYSCFISYSSKDQEFADRLHADLQNKGVRCWFAPHDMPIGAKIIDAIDEAIRLRDKVLLILSENSVASDWVEGEVTRSLDEERERQQVVLFPVRIDDTVLQTTKPWTRLLRGQRNIGNFTCWKEHDAYQKVLEKLLRDLTVAQAGPSTAYPSAS